MAVGAAAAIGGAAVGGGAGFGTAVYGAQRGASESSRGRRQQRLILQNQVQWRVNDLKAAGLNPILAAQGALGGGFGGGSASSGAGNAPGADVAGSARKGALLAEEVKTARAMRVQAEERAKLAPKQALAELSNTAWAAESHRQQGFLTDVRRQLDELSIPTARIGAMLDTNTIGKRSRQWDILKNRILGIPIRFGGGKR